MCSFRSSSGDFSKSSSGDPSGSYSGNCTITSFRNSSASSFGKPSQSFSGNSHGRLSGASCGSFSRNCSGNIFRNLSENSLGILSLSGKHTRNSFGNSSGCFFIDSEKSGRFYFRKKFFLKILDELLHKMFRIFFGSTQNNSPGNYFEISTEIFRRDIYRKLFRYFFWNFSCNRRIYWTKLNFINKILNEF